MSTRTTNRLASETSPYLQQHALNPVDWYPWCEEAIALARELNKPIFLSVGYSACHWCHVMEHESFEDEEIAALMNERFVCIKVDREERPDVDQIYMNAVQLMTGRGGWPMSVFLTPDLKPFYGGTYWPPRARMGMPGFEDVLKGVHEAWLEKRDKVDAQAEQLTDAVSQASGIRAEPTDLNVTLLQNAERELLRAADRTHGGFGRAPKFPHPMDIRVLLRTWRRFGNDDALNVATQTLDLMSRGGIYDHLGGGFHRYSTDARWLVPHFEKMLYDNGLLTPAYIEAYQATGNEDYARVARETLDYVLREMTQPEGGFYSTQDADSEGEEGRFFVWYEDEVMELLGADDGQLFCHCYDITADGNWEGKSILNRPKPHDQDAEVLGRTPEQLEELLARCRQKLFEARTERIAPGRDDKVLASWNGLMIAAMAQAGRVLDEPRYTQAASRAATFILDRMRDQRRLLHSFKDSQARFNAYLDDYVCLIDGLVELTQATCEGHWLTSAIELAERVFDQFSDSNTGAFFYTSADHEELITRAKDCQDNATPSGNGMAAYAMLRLGRLASRPDIEEKAVATLEALSGQMEQLALASGQALLALDWHLGPTFELVLFAGDDEAQNHAAASQWSQSFLENHVGVTVHDSAGTGNQQTPLQPLLQGRNAIDNQLTLYVCRQGTCRLPVTGLAAVAHSLDELKP